jgi:hypothetical protein
MRTTRLISSSRPMTGSRRAALAVRSVPYLASASKLASPLALSIFWSCQVQGKQKAQRHKFSNGGNDMQLALINWVWLL